MKLYEFIAWRIFQGTYGSVIHLELFHIVIEVSNAIMESEIELEETDSGWSLKSAL